MLRLLDASQGSRRLAHSGEKSGGTSYFTFHAPNPWNTFHALSPCIPGCQCWALWSWHFSLCVCVCVCVVIVVVGGFLSLTLREGTCMVRGAVYTLLSHLHRGKTVFVKRQQVFWKWQFAFRYKTLFVDTKTSIYFIVQQMWNWIFLFLYIIRLFCYPDEPWLQQDKLDRPVVRFASTERVCCMVAIGMSAWLQHCDIPLMLHMQHVTAWRSLHFTGCCGASAYVA